MDAERWSKVKHIFEQALERSLGEHDGFIAEACAGDEALRGDIETLLRNADAETTFLRSPALRLTTEEQDDQFAAGRRIGSYEIVRELGKGGMGSVYLAVRADQSYRKSAAIKVVQRGMENRFVLARFRAERQILAALDHPNIARLLDGGSTADGRPYFVMEYVEGKPIDISCDERCLSISDRIQLFLDVCAAVQHAHQHLVVHRDLKPSNILVTTEGSAKLLDFGIAKLIAPVPETVMLDLTGPSVRLMTPEYASPEQVRGEPVTTATDIYSLGVVLYRLLTGRRPYYEKSPQNAEIGSVICEQPPQRPSAAVMRPPNPAGVLQPTPEEISRTREGKPERLRRRLAGDLDTILLMALRKEPSRRYTSVEQFADDLRRHLSHLPVRAGPDTLQYRAVKFVRRNAAASITAALLAVSLCCGVVTTSWQARIARSERNRAERRFAEFLDHTGCQ